LALGPESISGFTIVSAGSLEDAEKHGTKQSLHIEHQGLLSDVKVDSPHTRQVDPLREVLLRELLQGGSIILTRHCCGHEGNACEGRRQ